MYIFIYVCMYTYRYTYIHTYVYIFKFKERHSYTQTYIRWYCIYIYMRMCVYIYIITYIQHTFIHLCKSTHSCSWLFELVFPFFAVEEPSVVLTKTSWRRRKAAALLLVGGPSILATFSSPGDRLRPVYTQCMISLGAVLCAAQRYLAGATLEPAVTPFPAHVAYTASFLLAGAPRDLLQLVIPWL